MGRVRQRRGTRQSGLSLTGIGLAWMIFGRGLDPVHSLGQSSGARPVQHDRAAPATPAPAPAPASATAARTMATLPGWASNQGRSTGYSAGHSTGQSTGTDKEHGMTDMAKDKARHLRDRLTEGTEGLGEEARRRIATARHKALDASDAVSRQLAQANRQVARSFEREPLLFGALALIGGAALGALLPGTRREDELLGEYRDQLFDEAEAIYQDEKGRIASVVSAGLDEAKSAASSVVVAAKDELTDDSAGKTSSGSGSPGKAGAAGTASSSGATGTPTV